ncbi:hypothetical protein V2A60_008831 [Cordyceps javanica]
MAEAHGFAGHTYGDAGILSYRLANQQMGDQVGNLGSSRHTDQEPRFSIVGATAELYPPSKAVQPIPSSHLWHVGREQQRWLTKFHPEAAMGNFCFQEPLRDDMAKFKTAETSPSDGSLLALGTMQTVSGRQDGDKAVPFMASATGVSGELLRLTVADQTDWEWGDSEDVSLKLSVIDPLQNEREIIWATDGLPITQIKYVQGLSNQDYALNMHSATLLSPFRKFWAPEENNNRILAVENCPTTESRVFVLTEKNIVWAEIRHDQDRPKILAVIPHVGDVFSMPKMTTCAVKDGTSMVFTFSTKTKQLSVYWFKAEDDGPVRWHRHVTSLPSPVGPSSSPTHVSQITVTPLHLNLSGSKWPSGLGAKYKKAGVEFFQVNLLSNNLSLRYGIYATVYAPGQEVVPPTKRLPRFIGPRWRKRRDHLLRRFEDTFVLPDGSRAPLTTWYQLADAVGDDAELGDVSNGMETEIEKLFDASDENKGVPQIRHFSEKEPADALVGFAYLFRNYCSLWLGSPGSGLTDEVQQQRKVWIAEVARNMLFSCYGVLVQDVPVFGPQRLEAPQRTSREPPSSNMLTSSPRSSQLSQAASESTDVHDSALARLSLLAPSLSTEPTSSKSHSLLSYWPAERGHNPEHYVSTVAVASDDRFRDARERLQRKEARRKSHVDKFRRQSMMRQGTGRDPEDEVMGSSPGPTRVQVLSSQAGPSSSQTQAQSLPPLTMSQPVSGAFGARKKKSKPKRKSGFR